jgi:glycosyltransferase involved in cell wall biosynthesis
MNLPAQSVTEYIQLLKSRKLRYYNENFIESPIVSIISAFYNDFEYFEETYKSIIHQSFQNFEWLIVDSGSEDYKSLSLLQSIPQRSEKIKVFHQNTNMGVSTARNVAIDHAKGKYLFFMDSDDILDPTYIEKCVLFLELNPEFSFVNSYAVGFQNEEYWWNQGFNDPRRFINENLVTAMLLYRATDFKKIGGYDEKLRFYEDWERWLRALSKGQQAWTIPEYLHCYRRTNNGLLSRSRRNVQEEKRITKLIIDRYRQYWNQVPENFTIKPLRFNTEVLGNKLSIENFIQDDNNGRRILCLFPHLEIGGSDKFNIDLLTLLKERGFDITIATTLPSKNLWYSNFYKITPDIFNL